MLKELTPGNLNIGYRTYITFTSEKEKFKCLAARSRFIWPILISIKKLDNYSSIKQIQNNSTYNIASFSTKSIASSAQ